MDGCEASDDAYRLSPIDDGGRREGEVSVDVYGA